jgi:hypothetical protein
MKRPVERYHASARVYQAEPREWQYAKGSTVRRLNPAGCLYWEGQNWFVCEALAGRWVRVESVEHLLLVSYRHMYVREIDRQQRCTRPAGDVARCWQGSSVALRAPYEPCQHRKPGAQSVTDVLSHGVTHVLSLNISDPPLRQNATLERPA